MGGVLEEREEEEERGGVAGSGVGGEPVHRRSSIEGACEVGEGERAGSGERGGRRMALGTDCSRLPFVCTPCSVWMLAVMVEDVAVAWRKGMGRRRKRLVQGRARTT